MISRFKTILLLAVCVPCFFVSCKDEEEDPYRYVIIDFQDETMPGEGYINNAGPSNMFKKDIVNFPNYYYDGDMPYWTGVAYSQKNDMTTEGIGNQYSVYATNNPSGNTFLTVFPSDPTDYSPKVSITFDQPVRELSFTVSNATYAALVMKNGDSDFGVEKFGATDWYKLLIQVYDENDKPLIKDKDGKVAPGELFMAEGTDIYNTWESLQIVGADISRLEFTVASSDMATTGYINTPTYFCLDNIAYKTLINKK